MPGAKVRLFALNHFIFKIINTNLIHSSIFGASNQNMANDENTIRNCFIHACCFQHFFTKNACQSFGL